MEAGNRAYSSGCPPSSAARAQQANPAQPRLTRELGTLSEAKMNKTSAATIKISGSNAMS